MKKLELVDFLKGFSIFTIIVYHLLQSLHMPGLGGKLIAFGGTGIHLFILLSGFGLYLSHIYKPVSYVGFIKKRIIKVYFPYIVIVLISALITFVLPIYKSSYYAFFGHVFLYKMFDESIMGSYGYPLWFVSMIIQFYVAFSVLTYLKEKTNNTVFIAVSFIVSICWIAFVVFIGKESERVWNSFFLSYLWEFSIGMVLAEAYSRNNNLFELNTKRNNLFIVGVVNCALYAGLALKGGDVGKMINDIPALIGYTSIAIWIYQFRSKLINSFMLFTGKISYSLYLLHTLVQLIMLYYLGNVNIYLALVLALILVYMLAVYYQKSIEFAYKNIFKI